MDDGSLTADEAVRFLSAILAEEEAESKPWAFALGGIWQQVMRGEITIEEMNEFLRAAVNGEHVPYLCMTMARAKGTKDGRACTVVRRSGDGEGWHSMSDLVGACIAAFVSLALELHPRGGALAPEDWVTPEQLYTKLEAQGTPAEMVVEPGYTFVYDDETTA